MPAISNTFSTDEPLLSDLLRKIEEGVIQLPDFQRGWVWDDTRIRALIASVSQGYPVGAVMSMETGDDGVRFSSRPFEGAKPTQHHPEILILDGQQRLTSLFLSLKNKEAVPTSDERKNTIKRFYYLNIAACLSDVDRFDAVISVPENKKLTSDFGRIVNLDLSTRDREYTSGMFPLNIIFDSDLTSQWLMGYQEYFEFNKDSIKSLFKFQTELIIPFQKYKIPVIKLLKETPKEAVCQVFENVNTGGVSLTVFELLTATYAAKNFPLRHDWEERNARLQEIDPVLQCIDETAYLTAITLLASYRKHLERGTAVSCKRKDVLNLELSEYRSCADDLIEGLRKSAKFLHSQKIFDIWNLPYQTQLIPLSVICACLGTQFEEHQIKQKISRWYWCGVLGELYGSANETRYALDIQNFMQWLDGGKEPVTIRDANFNPTRLLSLQTRNSAAYKGVMGLTMNADCKDFISGDTVQQTNYFDDKIDIHHIFPSNYCKQKNIPENLWNSVVNKTPLSARTNRILGGKAPSNYLDRLVSTHCVEEAALDAHLRSHLIDPASLKANAFEDFIVNRAKTLLDLIEGAMGKKVSGRDADETVKAFGATLT
ncbi:MAG: DUF262 domain-containing protein [Desulfovibrionaceae bacterium]|nr:DUF262 domain-containing protein [Desulfovibrionaceae bacterium]